MSYPVTSTNDQADGGRGSGHRLQRQKATGSLKRKILTNVLPPLPPLPELLAVEPWGARGRPKSARGWRSSNCASQASPGCSRASCHVRSATATLVGPKREPRREGDSERSSRERPLVDTSTCSVTGKKTMKTMSLDAARYHLFSARLGWS